METLAIRTHMTRTPRGQDIREGQRRRLAGQPMDYMYHVSFDDPAMEHVILAAMPDEEEYEARRHLMSAPTGVPPELSALYEVPLLSKDQEQHLFRKMNFLKHKAAVLRRRLLKGEGDEVGESTLDLHRIEGLEREANEIKGLLISANMRLVANIARKRVAQGSTIWELMSDGNLSLIRAVEKFDFSRGFKFSTYASWAIMKNFSRSLPEEQHRRERFVTGHEDAFRGAEDPRSNEHEALATTAHAAHCVNRLLEYLEPRERAIIRMRAGLEDHARGMTLNEIGRQFGITKERARQLSARAMKKLRDIACKQQLDLL